MASMGKHFGEWLRSRRKEMGLGVRGFGDLIERTHTAVSLIERGEMEPSAEMIDLIAGALNVPREEVVMATFPDRFDEPERLLLKRWLSGQP